MPIMSPFTTDTVRCRPNFASIKKYVIHITGKTAISPQPSAAPRSASAGDLAAFMAAHGVTDLGWTDSRLDEALDLMAICAREPAIVERALAALGAD